MFYDICILNIYKKPICDYNYFTYTYDKLDFILDSSFIYFIKCNTLIIRAFK